MNTEKAIKYFKDEIRYCENAPALNGCEMTSDWMLTLEASRAALAALREKQERENPKPLTEDELRQMLGEPVWCVYDGGASWFIVHESLFTIINGMTAYRYKPGDHFREVTKMIEEVQGNA